METKYKHVFSVKELVKILKENSGTIPTEIAETGVVTDNNLETATKAIESRKFVDEWVKDNGTRAMISLRIRRGYIGKEITRNGVKCLQTERSQPLGVIVAIKDPNNKKTDGISYGVSYISPKEKESFPIIGLANALKRAIDDANSPVDIMSTVRNPDKELLEFFMIRSKAYFYPEEYSRKHNAPNPISYPNYEEIHKNRRMLGYN